MNVILPGCRIAVDMQDIRPAANPAIFCHFLLISLAGINEYVVLLPTPRTVIAGRQEFTKVEHFVLN